MWPFDTKVGRPWSNSTTSSWPVDHIHLPALASNLGALVNASFLLFCFGIFGFYSFNDAGNETILAWASDGFFSGGSSGFFQVMAKIIFPWGETVVKFHFTNSKLKEKHFSTKTFIRKYQILQFRGKDSLQPLTTSMLSWNVLLRYFLLVLKRSPQKRLMLSLEPFSISDWCAPNCKWAWRFFAFV